MTERSWRGVAWEVGYEHFVAHLAEHGSGQIRQSHVCEDGFRLGGWVSTQRSFRRNGRMTPDRLALLDQHDFDWDPGVAARGANLALLEEYRIANGDINVPVMYRTKSGKPIGKWLQAQIGAYHEGRLADDVRAGLEELRRYIEAEGDAHVPNAYVSPSGFTLGRWFARQKSMLKKASLPPHRARQLRDLGVDPDRDMRDEAWFKGFEELRTYFDDAGDARVPSYYETVDGYPLGSWRRVQRTKLKRGQLRADRKALLDELDPSWNESRPTGWTDGQALDALREAATMAYPLTSSEYESLRMGGAVRGPAFTWFAHHFASWAAACDAAGVDGGADLSGAVVYSDADLEASALQFFTERGIESSRRTYTIWLASNPGHPSAASIIRRFGSWPAIRHRIASRVAPEH